MNRTIDEAIAHIMAGFDELAVHHDVQDGIPALAALPLGHRRRSPRRTWQRMDQPNRGALSRLLHVAHDRSDSSAPPGATA